MSGPNEDKTLSEFGSDCIKLWEEDSLVPKLTAYDDGAGTWTIGFGCTKGVHRGMTCTVAQAEQMFQSEMREFIETARSRITIPLSQNQFDSCVSFWYNEGSGAGASLVSAINSGDFARVPDAFLLYTKARHGGHGPLVTWPGLVDRRNKEIALWSGVYHDARIPSSVPMDVAALPMAIEPDALTSPIPSVATSTNPVMVGMKSPTVWSLLAAIGGGICKGFEWIINQLSDLAGSAGDIQAQAEAAASPFHAMLAPLKEHASQIGLYVTVACLVFAIARHVDLHLSQGKSV